MLSTPNANIKLTAEQNLQILEWQQRLSVIQDEIKIAQKNKASVEEEIETKVKHNNYLGELGTNLKNEVEKLTAQKEKLQDEVAQSTTTLSEHLGTIQERNNILAKREAVINDKEAHLNNRHEVLSEREGAHEKARAKLSEHELEVEHAREVISEALKSIKWQS